MDLASATAALRAGGSVAAEDEADILAAAARSPADLAAMVARRLRGEPAAWITGQVDFLGVPVRVTPGVFVPRWQTEAVAAHAGSHLPLGGVAVDLCTGSGAVAAALAARRPGARVVATDLDPAAVACARSNGVDAAAGDLWAPLPAGLRGQVDVVVAVAPYVPETMLAFLPRDVRTWEPPLALRGGPDGLDVVRRIVAGAPAWLRPGGSLVLEAGVDQIDPLCAGLDAGGLAVHEVLHDGDGDPCGVCATTSS